MPIKIDFLSNVSDLVRGTGHAEKALDDVADSLDDVADAAKTGGRDAERSVDRLEDSFRDAARRAKDLGDAGKTAGRDVDRGMRDADDSVHRFGKGAEEAGDELKQNLGETFSSFRGDLEDLPQIAQDVFGGLAGSVDGLGASFALAAGAAGVGLLVQAIQLAGEEQQKIKDRAGEWANGFIEAGGRVLDFQTRMAAINDVITSQYDEAKKNSELWGVSVQTAAAAMSGSEEAINRAQAGIDRMSKASGELAATGATVTDEFGNITMAGSDLAGTAVAGQAALDGFKQSLSLAKDMAGASAAAMIDQARATEGAIEKVDEFGDTVITLPDGKQVYIDAETGRATQNVDAIKNQIYSVPESHSTTFIGNVAIDDAQARINRFMSDNDGRSFTMYGRVKVDPGGPWD
jgi:uncharacterized protein YlzI (FlbEa/FlbD family)